MTPSGAAENLAAWHDTSVRALGLRPTTTESWWTCPTPAPNIYHTAISLRPSDGRRDATAMLDELRAHLDDPASGYVSVCDSWNEHDLTTVGLERRAQAPWLARPPGLLVDAAAATDLEIEGVHDNDTLAVFEETVVRGFGARMPVAPFDIHAPAILDDPAMSVFLGRVDGAPVSVAMAYVTEDLLGVYGVATVEAARRRGYADAMTRAALRVAPDRPAMLQPSAQAMAIYRRLDFADDGWFSHWT